ncbi:MAG: hypothetical protein A3C93_01435 [Candidatus Lloydbacteria bacterium RIFCSPHIGHO2_02_FULL_54_17]|uniref:Uncharacterized protein n=1 Tax=Candidatus Lloydbacteria bacterium RIFCSPHIGHO2_02_FULL_54_17 TaxID=1798664 RepID=A0A1G2DBJ2_9BACT|nr:MAG: hypothetical protein A2762_00360 [Candidatus Lloydbacteria bacterium RIFCSPHIGHO2_01_FULL_54_11]OGZ10994.1 MAG: hypothetical protein A3C93_01435 [Candidatus Lloydbacteria bacterium RIFCSPHIGHO2_02_FULL_54_17]OGZ13145.1 MAG: hypothetical protein A2948_02130 [Candidatus Lloydbacteria bacterium RIFCSPLOWO2_01_FULL_54_18]OGZ14858.1 MAG: hypothetical protein A3H76_06220 [Candidatus Lloydbacteria bacterium RIFCSPLOWO2_02_FULL_54_12]
MHLGQKKLFAALSVGIFVGVIIFYSYLQSRAIIAGPKIIVDWPKSGSVATTSLVTVLGTIAHANEVTLQGRPIFIDLDGRFSEQLLLMEGYNIIELTAKDIEGRMDKKTIELVYGDGI